MSRDTAMAIAQFYDVYVNYILGLSDSRQEKTDDIVKEYGLTDAALEKLANIKRLDKMQQKENPDLPTDMDVINALFESEKFQLFVELIREATILRGKADSVDYYDSLGKRNEFVSSLSDEQRAISSEGNLTVLTSQDSLQYLTFQLQQTTLQVVNDIMDNL
jgi:hypothetical protein